MMKYLTILIIILISCKSESNNEIIISTLNKKGDKEKVILKNKNLNELITDNEAADKVVFPSNVFDATIELSELIESLDLVFLETNKKTLFGRVNKILFNDNNYFIHDKRNDKLLRFNEQGKFLNNIGVIGHGPQELLSYTDVTIDKKNNFVSILDSKSGRITKFNNEGKYINSNSLFYVANQHEYLNDSIAFSIERSAKNTHIPSIDPYSLVLADSDKIPFGIAFKNIKHSPTYTTVNPLKSFGDKVYFHKPFSNGIWEVKTNALIPIVKFKFEENGLPNNLWKEKLSNKSIRELIQKKSHFMGEYVTTNKYCFFNLFGNNKMSSCFYNRNSKSLLYGSTIKLEDKESLSALFFRPLGSTSEDKFFTMIEAIRLVEFREVLLKDKGFLKYIKSEDIKKIKEIKQADNPVIITYKLKDF